MPDETNLPSAGKVKRAQWVTSMARLASNTQQSPETKMRTMVTCDIRSGKRAIYVPPDMVELQPRALNYLQGFARHHELQLVEDRRRTSIQPKSEKRSRTSPMIAKALSELLQQLGMPGEAREQSYPHRLNADSPHISIDKLICMAAFSTRRAKRVLIQPNRKLVGILDNNSQAITAYGCKLITADASTVLSHFDSPHFRAIAYSAGSQYVVHVCLAGGPLANPALWASFHTLTRTDFQFQLFTAKKPCADFGLFFATFYLDLADSPTPWWLDSWADARPTGASESKTVLLKRAS